ncbi:phosducin-like protein [Pecten maximus]|uniref:phosducin-like protein n=1 Tax=Pecten maximus TaxID=6579 RepID=UPI001458A74F|nr:phosducin-like protein [Pecten maximus]XP_033746490.1 phosducin-like protein [Pecten maximus]XP_033746491.1 phosducin-like protein [Pecten maximus]XP_033746492.1 phosducin-like protein [Pecten maximus]XP_033746493.1 phosducin-like protein [Pecten maximus]
MALSLDDRILGEKVNNYCSSSEDEGEDEETRGSDPEEYDKKTIKGPKFIPEPEIQEYQGYSTNTGPKGVINDWREFKRLENERREAQEKEKLAMMKKLSMTCRSHLDDEKEKQKDEELLQELEELEDDFLKEYRMKRLEEMRKALQNVPKFGKVVDLNSDSFVEAIDKELPQVTVIIHLYEDKVQACEAMNGCLACLAQDYPSVKFCKIKASETQLSNKFAKMGVPALLAYKGGELIGNFVKLTEELGKDFFSSDVESFLYDFGLLPSNDIINQAIKDTTTGELRTKIQADEDSGSEFELD